MRRALFLMVSGMVCLVSWGSPAWTAEAQDPADELRALRAENTMLRMTITNLRAENVKLKAEIKRLQEPPKQIDANTSKPSDTQPTMPKAGALAGNANVVKALKKYATVSRSTDATKAQKAEAYSVFCTEIAEMPLTVTYTVDEVTIKDDDTATIAATTDRKNRDWCVLGNILLSIKVPRATALQLKKGNILTVTGTVEKLLSGRNSRPVGSVHLGGWVVATTEGDLGYVMAGDYGALEVMAKKGFVVTLNGKRVEAVVPEGR